MASQARKLTFTQSTEGYLWVDGAKDFLYHDLDDALAAKMESQLVAQVKKSFASPVPPQAWAEGDFNGKIAYMRCTEDRAVPAAVQDAMIEGSGVKWSVKNIDSAHSPFLKEPKKVAVMMAEWMKEFES